MSTGFHKPSSLGFFEKSLINLSTGITKSSTLGPSSKTIFLMNFVFLADLFKMFSESPDVKTSFGFDKHKA